MSNFGGSNAVENLLRGRVSDLLAEIKSFFVPEAQLVLLIRVPGNKEADIAFGDMHPKQAIALLRRRMAGERRGS